MSYHPSRFICPSLGLNLRDLARQARKGLWAATALALAVHLVLSRIGMVQEEQRSARPLTTKFVKRQPRLTKPLEMKKRPRPRRRHMRREMVSVQAKVQRGTVSRGIQPLGVLGQLARPNVDVSRAVGFRSTELAPQAVAQIIEGARDAENVVDMSLEMLDVDALDTGRYHAMVIQDPSDKRNIKGFFRLKYAYSETMQKRASHDLEDRMVHGVVALLDAMNQYTNIRASFAGRILFTSAEMMKTPWVFSNITWPFVLPDDEAAYLGKYLVSGGFLICDALEQSPFYISHSQKRPPICITSARSNFKKALAAQRCEYGRDWTFQILPNDHPLFHCYFDFDGAPGSYYDPEFELSGKLEGICVGGRWVVVICQKGFQHFWSDPAYPEMRSERLIQLGVNSIIFALTQEGSITRRVMDEVR